MIQKIIAGIKAEIRTAQLDMEVYPDGYIMGLRMAMQIVWDMTGWKDSKVQPKENDGLQSEG